MGYSIRSIIISFTMSLMASQALADTLHQVHFENTDHELHVYEINGELPGKTMLIIGGMHNEPGGYVTADLFADIHLKKGRLIVVPRANMPAIAQNQRGINDDMNRTFSSQEKSQHQHIYEDDIVTILKTLIAKSDVLLNLHDGYGYYRPEWQDENANPKRWGQAIITDRESFFVEKTGKTLALGERARQVVEKVNQSIADPLHIFHYKNTRTRDPDTIHIEQRHSATFYALYEQGIESYGIETSKNIASLDLKVSYQTMIVNAFLSAFDIIPEQQNLKLAEPKLSYLLVSINNQRASAYRDGEILTLNAGDQLRIVQAFTNYDRGVIVDLEHNGSLSDAGKTFSINKATSIRVLKDQYLAGRVYIQTLDPSKSDPKLALNTNQSATPSATPTATPSATPTATADANATVKTAANAAATDHQTTQIAHFLIEINGQQKTLNHGETLLMGQQDSLKLISYISNEPTPALQLNFVGFVGNPNKNDGQDAGYDITPANLLKRFSIDGNGKLYRIKAEHGKQLIAQFFVNTGG